MHQPPKMGRGASLITYNLDAKRSVSIDLSIQSNHLLGPSCQLQFQPMISYLISGTASPVMLATAYLNRDINSDIVSVNKDDATITVLLGYGNGTFKMGNTYSTGKASAPCACAIADLNNDSRMDVVVANADTSNIAIFLGNGDGTFQTKLVLSTGSNSNPVDVVIGYINNDTRLDIAVVDYVNDNVGVFLGYGNGTFQAQKTTGAGPTSSPSALVLGDFNRDGLQDLAVAAENMDAAVLLLGRGNGIFRAAILHNVSGGPSNIDRADFNGDRILDLAVINQRDSSVSILLGNGNGSFITATELDLEATSDVYGLVVIDLNQDGHQDLIVSNNADDSISIFLGQGDGFFQEQDMISVDVDSSPSSIVAVDFNNDGRLDLAVSNFGSNTVGILLRTC